MQRQHRHQQADAVVIATVAEPVATRMKAEISQP